MLLNIEDAKAIGERMHLSVAPQILNMLVPARLPLQRVPSGM